MTEPTLSVRDDGDFVRATADQDILLDHDPRRISRWRNALNDLAQPSFVRLAAATHLALTEGRKQPAVEGSRPQAAALAMQLGICSGAPNTIGRSAAASGTSSAASGSGGAIGAKDAAGMVGNRSAYELVDRCIHGRPIGAALLEEWVGGVTDGSVDRDTISVWLAVMNHRRLCEADLFTLTAAMLRSGRTSDYRVPGVWTVRRYPTGGLSEKLALVLPALLVEATSVVAVRSAFLVARSLAHTGGTWDKLSAIPGFRFPRPGAETRRVLERVGVAMVVSTEEFCPADRILYSLRSLTDTVASTDLIVSSIASKLCASVVDDNVLDVRYGPHSFLPDRVRAAECARLVVEAAAVSGTRVRPVLTHDTRPDGTALGNALEVAESLAVLGIGPRADWDRKGIDRQRHLAARMLNTLLAPRFPQVPWDRWAQRQMASGSLGAAYVRLLEGHAVAGPLIERLLGDPWQALGISAPDAVASPSSGTVRDIDYATLGRIVNQKLARQHLPGGHEPGYPVGPTRGTGVGDVVGSSVNGVGAVGEFGSLGSAVVTDLTAGVILRAAVGDHVRAGDPLLTVHTRVRLGRAEHVRLAAAYRIDLDGQASKDCSTPGSDSQMRGSIHD